MTPIPRATPKNMRARSLSEGESEWRKRASQTGRSSWPSYRTIARDRERRNEESLSVPMENHWAENELSRFQGRKLDISKG